MARLKHLDYAVLELNRVAFPTTGRIEAQCALDPASFTDTPAENGMLLAVDRVNRLVKLPTEDSDLPIALHYSAEHLYDERFPELRKFHLFAQPKTGLYNDTFLPRLGYLSVGDLFTTNCIEGMEELPEDLSTPLYGTTHESGAILVSATKPTKGVILQVVELNTLPDGQPSMKFHVIQA